MRTLVVGAGDGCYKLAAALEPILRITLAVVLFPRGAQKVLGCLIWLQIVSASFRIRRELSQVRPGLLPFDRGWWLTGHVKKNRINLAFPQADYFVRHLVNEIRR